MRFLPNLIFYLFQLPPDHNFSILSQECCDTIQDLELLKSFSDHNLQISFLVLISLGSQETYNENSNRIHSCFLTQSIHCIDLVQGSSWLDH